MSPIGTLEKWRFDSKEDLGGGTDIVRLDERDTVISGGPIGIKDEDGVHFVSLILEYTTRTSVCVCGVGLDCRSVWATWLERKSSWNRLCTA